jgi:predicted nuclease of predicted toxin-antitoxin system
MPRYLVDANLPYYFSLWNNDDYIHQHDIDSSQKDSMLWEYAKEHDLTIITKDSDFSDRILVLQPPPRIIRLAVGNVRMRQFYQLILPVWQELCELSRGHKLVVLYEDRIEAVR